MAGTTGACLLRGSGARALACEECVLALMTSGLLVKGSRPTSWLYKLEEPQTRWCTADYTESLRGVEMSLCIGGGWAVSRLPVLEGGGFGCVLCGWASCCGPPPRCCGV